MELNFKSAKTFTSVEIVLAVLFVLFVVVPLRIPPFLAEFFDSALGVLLLFLVALYLFIYHNPIVGILFLFVSYELVRRSSQVTSSSALVHHSPSQTKKDKELKELNDESESHMATSLEQEMVLLRAPPKSDNDAAAPYVESQYKPVADKLNGASFI